MQPRSDGQTGLGVLDRRTSCGGTRIRVLTAIMSESSRGTVARIFFLNESTGGGQGKDSVVDNERGEIFVRVIVKGGINCVQRQCTLDE